VFGSRKLCVLLFELLPIELGFASFAPPEARVFFDESLAFSLFFVSYISSFFISSFYEDYCCLVGMNSEIFEEIVEYPLERSSSSACI
jgi:hypothetical protein